MHFYHQEAILPIRVASERHEPRILESLQEILKPAVKLQYVLSILSSPDS